MGVDVGDPKDCRQAVPGCNNHEMSHNVQPSMPHILIVEDEDAIAAALAYALSTDGMTTTHVRLLADARRELAERRPALMILDVGLPDGSGFELCREVRSGSSLPIILLTARSEEIDRVVGLELGADDYVTKPFSPREVSLRVRSVLRRASADPMQLATTLFRVDEDLQRIAFSGTLLSLTRREFLLLKTLLVKPGRVCSRERFLDAAWGAEAESGDRTVDTHIKTLRAKLKAIRPEPDPIETHRGLGYSINTAGGTG